MIWGASGWGRCLLPLPPSTGSGRAPSTSLSPLQLPTGLFGTIKQTDAVSTGSFLACLLPAPLPPPLPGASLSNLPVPTTDSPSTCLLTTYPGQQRRSGGERWWQAGFAGLGDPQASSPSGLVSLGCSSPGVPDPTSAEPQTPPHFLPSPAEMGFAGPTAGLFGWRAGGSPWWRRLQAVSGEEPLLAPVATTTPLRGGCLGGGKRLVQGLARHWKGNPPRPRELGFGGPAAHRQSRVVVVPSLVVASHWPWAKLVPSLSLCVLTSFFKILINLFGCIGSQSQHMRSLLCHAGSFAGAHRFSSCGPGLIALWHVGS